MHPSVGECAPAEYKALSRSEGFCLPTPTKCNENIVFEKKKVEFSCGSSKEGPEAFLIHRKDKAERENSCRWRTSSDLLKNMINVGELLHA